MRQQANWVPSNSPTVFVHISLIPINQPCSCSLLARAIFCELDAFPFLLIRGAPEIYQSGVVKHIICRGLLPRNLAPKTSPLRIRQLSTLGKSLQRRSRLQAAQSDHVGCVTPTNTQYRPPNCPLLPPSSDSVSCTCISDFEEDPFADLMSSEPPSPALNLEALPKISPSGPSQASSPPTSERGLQRFLMGRLLLLFLHILPPPFPCRDPIFPVRQRETREIEQHGPASHRGAWFRGGVPRQR